MAKDKLSYAFFYQNGEWVIQFFETKEKRDAFIEFRRENLGFEMKPNKDLKRPDGILKLPGIKYKFPKGGFVNNATEKIINPKNTVTIGPNDEPKTRKNRLHSRRKYLTSNLRKINSHFIKTRIDD